MKRSVNVNLSVLRKKPRTLRAQAARPLAVAIAAISIAGCSSKEDVKLVTSVEQCYSDTDLTRQQCQEAYARAVKTAECTGPKYTSLAECEKQHGSNACQSSKNSSGSSIFLPMVAGFMVGQMLSDNRGYYNYNPIYRNDTRYYDRYRGYNRDLDIDINTRSDQYRSGSKYSTTSSTQSKQTTTASRGGFGSKASAKSSWGGGKSSGGWGG